MSAYYNENDKFAAAWLRELMKDGLIAPGWVDERSIADVLPIEIEGFTQCHFFAGIGVWSLALRLAGWPDDRPAWTGSAPCQPFSAAGKGAGFDDERHLWPAWFHLITHGKRRDVPVLGEQVASKDGRAWFDLVSSDMQGLDHSCGAVDTSAASLGAPFIGQRLYWLGATNDARWQGRIGMPERADQRTVGPGGLVGRLAASEGTERQRIGTESVAFTINDGRTDGSNDLRPPHQRSENGDGIPLHPVDYWRDADWLLCRDPNGPRFRPVEPGTFPLVDARAVVNRLAAVRGAGNALNVSQATCFVEAVMDYLDQ